MSMCNSDTRNPEGLEGDVTFISFPKPKRKLEQCKRWIKACGRPHDQLNIEIVDGNYHMFVCTKHFPEGRPTERYPDPVPANPKKTVRCTTVRAPPKRQPLSEPPRKRRPILTDVTSQTENAADVPNSNVSISSASTQTECSESNADITSSIMPEVSPLDMLALAAENRALTKQLAEQLLQNETLRRNNQTLKDGNTQKPKKADTYVNVKSFNVELIRDSPVKDSFKYYSGFIYGQFLNIFKFPIDFPKQFPVSKPEIRRSTAFYPD